MRAWHPDRRTLLQALALLSVSRQSAGATMMQDVQILTAGDTPTLKALAQALSTRMPSARVTNDPGDLARGPTSATIVLGVQALQMALNMGVKGPAIAVLSSSQAQPWGLGTGPSRDRPGWSALYTDASALSQFMLIDALFERKVSVGVLLSEASAHLERALQQPATSTNMEIIVARLAPQDNVVRALNRIAEAQVLLTVADSQLYTPDSLRAVLESTYRRGLPVVGFSPATVAAGTLASACSDVSDLASDLMDWAEGLKGQPGTGGAEARHCRYWKVKVNENVARSLGINLSSRLLKLGPQPSARFGR